jgi:hypothetical protein
MLAFRERLMIYIRFYRVRIYVEDKKERKNAVERCNSRVLGNVNLGPEFRQRFG